MRQLRRRETGDDEEGSQRVSRKSPMSYKQRRYAEFKLNGICPMCKKRPLPKDEAKCEVCSKGSTRPTYACTRCLKMGHNVRTCSLSKAAAEKRA